MDTLDLATQTLFADFQENVLMRYRLEEDKARKEIYVRKKVKDKLYWYQQTNSGLQKNKQTYFGPVNDKNTKIVEKHRQDVKKQNQQIRNLIQRERKKISILKKAGFPEVDRKTAKILIHFSKIKLSYQHGVLVGSLAFFAYPGILGITFDHGKLKTDIDIARNEKDPVSLTTTEEVFREFSEDIYAIPGLKHLDFPSSFLFQNEIKIDFLIPKFGKEKKSYEFPGIPDMGAQALRYLDYLIEERVQGVLLSKIKQSQ